MQGSRETRSHRRTPSPFSSNFCGYPTFHIGHERPARDISVSLWAGSSYHNPIVILQLLAC